MCFGKVFAELVGRILILSIFETFDLEFVDKKWNTQMQVFNLLTYDHKEPIMVRAKAL